YFTDSSKRSAGKPLLNMCQFLLHPFVYGTGMQSHHRRAGIFISLFQVKHSGCSAAINGRKIEPAYPRSGGPIHYLFDIRCIIRQVQMTMSVNNHPAKVIKNEADSGLPDAKAVHSSREPVFGKPLFLTQIIFLLPVS